MQLASRLHAFFQPIFITLLIFFTVTTVFAQSADPARIFITEINADGFPSVDLTIRAFGENNAPVTGLSADDIRVFENGSPAREVRVSQGESVPSVIFFLVDRGQYSNFINIDTANIIRGLEQFAIDGHFRDEIDTVALIATDPMQPSDISVIVPPTQSAEEFRAAVTQMQFSATNKASTIDGIQYAFNQLERLADSGAANLAVVYVGAIFDGDRQSIMAEESLNLAKDFQSNGTRFYAIDTLGQFADPIRSLVENSGGQYLSYDDSKDNSSAFEALYKDITAQAISYVINYTSNSSDSGIRQVTVAPAGVPFSEELQSLSYEQQLLPPTLEIINPSETGQDFQRIGEQTEEGAEEDWLYDRNAIPVEVVLLDWADGVDRDIRQVEFLVNGESIATSSSNDSAYKFNIDLSSYETEGTFAIPFSIRALDAFGLESEVESLVNLNVEKKFARRPTPTPGPSPTPIVQVTIETTRVVVPPCQEDPTGQDCITGTYLPWGLLGLSIIGLGFVSFRYRQQLQGAGKVIGNVAKQVRATILGGSARGQKIIARMEVIRARDDLVGKTIDIYSYTTSFGRDPRQADIQLYDEDDKSSVSGLHCTLQYEPSENRFLLTDHSTTGTAINDNRVAQDDPTRLEDGDVIMLGDEFRRGAKIKFNIVEQENSRLDVTKIDPAAREDEGTFVLFGQSDEVSRSRETVFEDSDGDSSGPVGNETVIDHVNEEQFDFDISRPNAIDEDDDWLKDLES